MSPASPRPPSRLALALFRAVLLASPRTFREEWGAEVVEVFRRRATDARATLSGPRLAWFWVREIKGALRTGMRLQREERIRRRGNTRSSLSGSIDPRGGRMLEGVWLDIQLAFRGMRKAPGFALTATLLLALAVGASTATFGVLRMAVFAGPPFPQAEQMVLVDLLRRREAEGPGRPDPWPYPMLLAVDRVHGRLIDPIAGFDNGRVTLTGMGPAEDVGMEIVSPPYFDVVGLPMVLGRGFLPEEGEETGPFHVVVVSHAFWRSRFGGDGSVLGRTLELDGEIFRVVGVASPGFRGLGGEADLWLPLGATAVFRPGRRSQDYNLQIWVAGRLAPGATLAAAREQMRAIGQGLTATWPADRYTLSSSALPDVWVNPGARTAAKLLALAAAMVLLVACANLSGLLLTRARRKVRDGAVRMALGASRWGLVRLCLVESLVLAGLGGGAGLGVAALGTRVITAIWPEGFLNATGLGLRVVDTNVMGLDGAVLVFAILVVFATAFLVGIITALRTLRGNLTRHLKEGGGTQKRGRLWGLDSRSTLVGFQVALALILLIGAGLVVESVRRLLEVEEGFRTEHLLTFDFTSPQSLPGLDLGDPSTLVEQTTFSAAFDDRLIERIEALPVVESATVGCSVLQGYCGVMGVMAVDGRAFEEEPRVGVITVREGYFETLGIPILHGRGLDTRDNLEAPPVVVLSELAAQTFFPGRDPLGHTISIASFLRGREEAQVIGVAGDVLFGGPEEEDLPAAYFSTRDRRFANHTIVRTIGRPERTVQAIRNAIYALDPTVALTKVASMDRLVSRSTGDRRMILWLLGVFATVTVVLSAVGTWSVVAYSVANRRRELSVRMALGAEGWDVVRLVTGQMTLPAVVGMALGLGGAFAGTRLLEPFLWQTEARDLGTFAMGSILLIGVVLLASYLPARRATRMDPAESLKAE